MPLRIAVVGAGGVGGWFGARLALLGADKVEVTFVVRPGAHERALRSTGLRVIEPSRDFTIASPRLVTTDELLAGAAAPDGFDVVLVCVKGYHLEAVLPVIKALLRPAGARPTAVLPLLNGMDAPTILARGLGSADAVLGGLCLILAEIQSPGTILLRREPPTITFGELSPAPGPLSDVVARLRSALLEVGKAPQAKTILVNPRRLPW